MFLNTFTATATAGATSLTAVGDVSALQAGDMLLIRGEREQIVQCVSVADQSVEFVPALRRPISGTSISFGALAWPVRLFGETPIVPFRTDRTEAFSVNFVEPY